MRYYAIMEKRLFGAQNKGRLKNFNPRNGFYLEDSESTQRELKFKDDRKDYFLLSWEEDTPDSLLPRYKESGNQPKSNKIFVGDQSISTYLSTNIDVDDEM